MSPSTLRSTTTVDPLTLLFTSAMAEEPLGATTSRFLDNEFGQDDVNKFASLAASRDVVGSLDQRDARRTVLEHTSRELLAPIGLGDQVRVTSTAGGRCWGVLCLHREDSASGFSDDELDLLRRIGPHLGGAFRRSLVTASADGGTHRYADRHHRPRRGPRGPSMNEQASLWLDEIAGGPERGNGELPMPILAVATQRTDRARRGGRPRPGSTATTDCGSPCRHRR